VFRVVVTRSHFVLFFFNHPATSEIYTLSLHDALPISGAQACGISLNSSVLQRRRLLAAASFARPSNASMGRLRTQQSPGVSYSRSEEHTSELQSRENLVCRLLLEKKNKKCLDRLVNEI